MKKLLPLLLALALLLTACAGKSPPQASAPAHTVAATAPVSPVPSRDADPTSGPSAPVPSAPTPTPAPVPTPTPLPDPDTPAEDRPQCTLSISCAVLLDRLEDLPEGKGELVPAEGWLLPPTAVALEEGDSVFDLLLRTCREEGIHMEFTLTPGLGTAYIEGIGNLYEFDCGALSGWIFAVDGLSPNWGCSEVYPQSGQRIEWCYTCDLGADLPHLTRS